ncbi:MAG: class I SAM-dependent methyltransferase [Actinobacteria bacterium]|nr:class I SAM-dependent methyltransferase [Actinomycetota bacterium]
MPTPPSDNPNQRRTWNGRVKTWHEHVTSAPGFEAVRVRLLELATEEGKRGDCLDLGCGSGFLSLPLAETARSVLAVDVSDGMLADLMQRAEAEGLDNVTVQAADLKDLALRPGSMDLIVSNYALHHLQDADKRALMRRCHHWLRPGGRIVIADMMFGRGLTAADRQMAAGKVRRMFKKGPAGWVRAGKNIVRFSLRLGAEQPSPPPFWLRALSDASFGDVKHETVFEEAGIVVGRKA